MKWGSKKGQDDGNDIHARRTLMAFFVIMRPHWKKRLQLQAWMQKQQ